MPLALAGEITKINCAAKVMEWIVHIYYRTVKFPKGNFSTALHIQDHARTVHCPVTTSLKILQVGQIEAPHIWRFHSQANLLLSLSLRIYSLCHTPSAPSPQHGMWHYLFFMILAGTQKSKRKMRAAVQEWEREQGANFLPVSGSISSAFSSNVWFLPKEISSPFLLFQMETALTASWTTCCRSLSPSSDSTAHQEQWPAIPALRFPREIPQTTAKGPLESKWKSQSSIHRLKSTAVGSMWPLDSFFPREFTALE